MSDATGHEGAERWRRSCISGELMTAAEYVVYDSIQRGRTTFQAACLTVLQSQHVQHAAHAANMLKAELAACAHRGEAPSDIAAALQRSEAAHLRHVYRLAAEIRELELAAGCNRQQGVGPQGARSDSDAATRGPGLYVPVTRKVSLKNETPAGAGGMR